MKEKKKQSVAVVVATVLTVTSVMMPVASVYANETDTVIAQQKETVQIKEAPPITLPQDLVGNEGQVLQDIVLPEYWKWADETTTISKDKIEYPARFSVDDVTYDYSDVEGYNDEGHYVERMVAVTVEIVEPEQAEPVQKKSNRLLGNTLTAVNTGDIAINSTNFPDKAFRQYVIDNFDIAPKDETLTLGEIDNVSRIDVSIKKDITDLTGIEHFTSLTDLICSNPGITSLDVSNNTALKYLSCNNTGITSLDVRNNMALTILSCNNTGITSLDVSNNKALEYLNCDNTPLGFLNIGENQKLTLVNGLPTPTISTNMITDSFNIKDVVKGIDVNKITITNNGSINADGIISNYDKNQPIMYEYDCGKTRAGSIKLTVTMEIAIDINEKNFPDEAFRDWLKAQPYGADGKLTSNEIDNVSGIDVRGNAKITNLTGIEHFTALTSLNCANTGITSLDVSNNTKLTQLHCSGNAKLANLTVAGATELTILECDNTVIRDLDVSKNTKLTRLYCYNNAKLAKLTVAGATELTNLSCYDTGITSLDVSKNTKLTDLYCPDTPLAYLNIGTNNNLTIGKSNLKPVSLEITEDSFNMADKFIGIELGNVTNVRGADYKNGIMSNYSAGIPITYTYDCGTSKGGLQTINVTINLTLKSVISVTENLNKAYEGVAVSSNPIVDIKGSTGKVSYKWEQKKNDNEWIDIDSAPTDAGTYRVTATVAADDKFDGAISEPMEFTISQVTNSWTDILSVTGWTFGDQSNDPTAKAKFGDKINYLYSNSEKGIYTDKVPTTAGTWYVKATVAGTDNYTGLESIISFTIAPKSAENNRQIAISDIMNDKDLDNLVIKDGDKELEKGTDYDVDRKQNGNEFLITITFKGNYTGVITKTYTIKDEIKDSESIPTGDNTNTGLLSMMILLSAGCIAFLKKDKKSMK